MIHSLWTDPQTSRRPEPIEAQITIRQTYTQLHLRLETPESSGDFVASKIVTKDDGTYQVCGVFQSQPRILGSGSQPATPGRAVTGRDR